MDKYLVFEVAGDPMKDLVGTAVVRNLKQKYPDRSIIVTSLFPEIWLHHPDVYRVYRLGATSYFYEDYIQNKDTLVFRLDPFMTEDFIYRRKHIIQIWSELYETPFIQKTPLLFFTARELEATEKMIKQPGPIFLFETRAMLNSNIFDVWKIAPAPQSIIPQNISQIILSAQKAGFSPLHIKRGDEPEIPGVPWLTIPLRQILCAVNLGAKNLLMNSFSLQAAAFFDKECVVISKKEDFKVWGYENSKTNQIDEFKALDILNALKFDQLKKSDIDKNHG